MTTTKIEEGFATKAFLLGLEAGLCLELSLIEESGLLKKVSKNCAKRLQKRLRKELKKVKQQWKRMSKA